mmetsp:Transcript_42315/g.68180  ORF Transcript_42315/g.68180 Transcript_42315/m.68180 type:complete len:141 (+) Transcript_42315:1080-1502(+)
MLTCRQQNSSMQWNNRSKQPLPVQLPNRPLMRDRRLLPAQLLLLAQQQRNIKLPLPLRRSNRNRRKSKVFGKKSWIQRVVGPTTIIQLRVKHVGNGQLMDSPLLKNTCQGSNHHGVANTTTHEPLELHIPTNTLACCLSY